MNPVLIAWNPMEMLAWEQSHYIDHGQLTTAELVTRFGASAALLVLLYLLFVQLAKFVHLLTYRPHRGDITVRRGLATLHV